MWLIYKPTSYLNHFQSSNVKQSFVQLYYYFLKSHFIHSFIHLFISDQRIGRTEKTSLLLGPVRGGTRSTPTNDRLTPRPPPPRGRAAPHDLRCRQHDEAQFLPLAEHRREVLRVRKVYFSSDLISCKIGNSFFIISADCNESSTLNSPGNSIPDCQSKLVIFNLKILNCNLWIAVMLIVEPKGRGSTDQNTTDQNATDQTATDQKTTV